MEEYTGLKWFRFSLIYEILYKGERFLHGLLILLFCMAMVLSTRIRSVYEKAQKTAEELTELSNSLEQQVQERTKQLERTNQNLRSSMQKTAEALAEIAVLEDRNRIAQDMHDRTGHALTAALIQIEAAKLLMKKDVNLALEKLEATRESVSSGLDSIRETVRMMKHDYEERSLVLSIQKLIQETEAAVGIQVIYEPQTLPELDPITNKTLYLALQEGLTNGIRHGKATSFELSLKADENTIYFQLANNGEAYAGQKFGFGLNTMRERIERLNGTMHLETTELHPCVLRITLPIESNGDEKEGAQ
ncbi:sensor histidine kinase [Fervidibacillus albus]